MAEFAIMPIEDYRRACDAIREKTGGTEGITSGELEAQILSIETGAQLPVLVSPGAAAQLLAGYQLIDQEGNVVDGAMPEVELAKPDIKIGGKYGNGNNSQIYVSVTQEPGYVSGGTKEAYATVPNMTQPRTVTPSLQPQTIRCNGYMMLTDILVEAVPEEIVPDWNQVTATAADVLPGKTIATADGIVEGAMPDATFTLGAELLTYEGKVRVRFSAEQGGYLAKGRTLDTDMRFATLNYGGYYTPDEERAITLARHGEVVLGDIVMDHIPYNYKKVSGVTARAGVVLAGSKFVDAEGNEVEGTMPNNGATAGTLDGLNTTSVNVPEGYTEGGEITFDDTALAARIDAI